jgi:hypothetical protein
MLQIAIVGGLLIILSDGLFIFSGGIFFVTLIIIVPIAIIVHLIFCLFEFFDELDDGSILMMGNIDFIIIFTAFDLMLYNNVIDVNIYLLLYFEDL